MTAINYVRNLAGDGLGAARFGHPHRELRSARRLVVRPGPDAARGHRSLALRQPAHWCWWGFSGYRTKRVGRGAASGIVEGGVVGLARSRRYTSGRINLIGRMTPAVMAGFAA